MNRCKTCAHWDRKYHIEPDQRLCLAKKLDSTDQDGARIAYVERRHAVFLATSPEFGCVHHAPIAGAEDAPATDPDLCREPGCNKPPISPVNAWCREHDRSGGFQHA